MKPFEVGSNSGISCPKLSCPLVWNNKMKICPIKLYERKGYGGKWKENQTNKLDVTNRVINLFNKNTFRSHYLTQCSSARNVFCE